MTWTECRDALRRYDKRVYLLALVAQIHEPVLSKCSVGARSASECALDATRRWCLGQASVEECRKAADAADDAADAAADAPAARALLVESLADAPTEWQDAVVADGNVRTATHVWWRDGRFGGRWKRLTDADLVRFDAVLERASGCDFPSAWNRHTPSESTTTTVT